MSKRQDLRRVPAQERRYGPGAGFGPAVAAGMMMAAGAPAMAQTVDGAQPVDAVAPAAAPSASAQVYEPAFFTRFAPSNASEMVGSIPGFSINAGDSRRGFGQGGANVLINGRRVSGKSTGTLDALSRISAGSVVRIEIVDGASLSLPGLSGQVANVITAPKGVTGRWKWSPQLRGDARPVIKRGDASVSGETGPMAWTLGLQSYGGYGSSRGPEYVTDASGTLIDLRQEKGSGGGSEPGFNGSFTWNGDVGDVFNVNGSLRSPDFGDVEVSRRSGPGQPDRERIFRSAFQATVGEFGGDYEFDAAGGRMKLIGLLRGEEGEDFGELFQAYADLSPSTGGRFASEWTSGERIGRAEYALPSGGLGDWQVAIEGAYNFLDVTSRAEDLMPDGVYVADGLPETTRIEETRSEVSVTYSLALAPGLDLQTTLAGEMSELVSSNGAGETRGEFVRPKGFTSLAWKASPDLDINLLVERRVGQLDFGDFASSRDLNNNTVQSGNVELVPDQSWVVEAKGTARLGGWGAVTLSAFAAAIEDVVDQVPIYFCDNVRVAGPGACGVGQAFDRREGVGNIDKAEVYGVGLEGTLNFDPLGFKGAKLDFEIEFEESRVTDPFTGEDRRISRTDISGFEAQFRHDVPGTNWAWGLGQDRFLDGPRFRQNSREQNRVKPAYTFYFIENKDVFGAKVWFRYMPSGPRETFTREVYADGRDGPLSFVEDRERTFANIFQFEASRSF